MHWDLWNPQILHHIYIYVYKIHISYDILIGTCTEAYMMIPWTCSMPPGSYRMVRQISCPFVMSLRLQSSPKKMATALIWHFQSRISLRFPWISNLAGVQPVKDDRQILPWHWSYPESYSGKTIAGHSHGTPPLVKQHRVRWFFLLHGCGLPRPFRRVSLIHWNHCGSNLN